MEGRCCFMQHIRFYMELLFIFSWLYIKHLTRPTQRRTGICSARDEVRHGRPVLCSAPDTCRRSCVLVYYSCTACLHNEGANDGLCVGPDYIHDAPNSLLADAVLLLRHQRGCDCGADQPCEQPKTAHDLTLLSQGMAVVVIWNGAGYYIRSDHARHEVRKPYRCRLTDD